MKFLTSSFFKKYLLPGFVFQSVVIAGGYGTGRELVEYFLHYGPLGGLLGMLITTAIWSILLVVTFEFARIFQAYDYRTFFYQLLGPFWFIFDILYFITLFLVLAVIGSAAGVLIRDNFGIPYIIGVMIMLAAIGFLTFKGKNWIERFLSSWSILLYILYGIFFIAALLKFGPQIQEHFSKGDILSDWSLGGFKYAFYNLGVIPVILFCLSYIETRKEAVSAGLLGGLIGIMPGFLFFITIVSVYPAVLSEEIPAVFILQKIGSPLLLISFQVILFGTLIETGTGLIHAVNERIQSALRAKGKELAQWQRPLVAIVLLLIGLGLSTFGLIDLIAKGFGSISWGFFFIFVIPIMSIGVYKIIRRRTSTNRGQ
jgi:uncharacterized membrane protein YkvI